RRSDLSSPRPSSPAAHRCATMSRRTAQWAISSTRSKSMIARDNRAFARAAREGSAEWSRVDAQPSTAPHVRSDNFREMMMANETILVETRGKVGIITLNRPQALNALNTTVMAEVVAALQGYEVDDGVGAIVITGSEKAFAAGADIKEMQSKTYAEVFAGDLFAEWNGLLRIRKPVIAAVAGYALGGGCELAMMCDFIIAGENAKFGQPEITLGVMPGMGGSQRLTRFVGKSKA